jgi:hypothetical protein
MLKYLRLMNVVGIEDLVEQSKKAILNPFRLDQCQKIATSQCSGTHATSHNWGYLALPQFPSFSG